METLRAEFIMAMDDDFNTALALSHVFAMVRVINKYLAEVQTRSKPALEQAAQILGEMIDVVGLDLKSKAESSVASSVVGGIVLRLVEFRKKARQEKDYRTGDLVRDLLSSQGIVVEDSKEGSRVKSESEPDLEDLMAGILQLRQSLRQERNFARADRLRDTLAEVDIVFEDTREGSRWRLVR